MAVHVLRCFPPEDGEFAAFVGACDEALLEEGSVQPELLERLVRSRYGRVVVHAQTDLAATRHGGRVWYVYRDGSALPGLRRPA